MEKKLSIGIFVDTYFSEIDGINIAVDSFARALAEKHDVTVFVPKSKHNRVSGELPYKLVGYRRILFMKHHDLDLIHIYSPFAMGKLGIKLAKKMNIPVVGTIYSLYRQVFFSRARNQSFSDFLSKKIVKVYNKCDLCLAVNEKVRSVYQDHGLKIETLIRHNGSDLQLVENKDEQNALKLKYEIHDNEKVLLFVGKINKVKNIFFLVEVLNELKKMKFDFKMMFIGSGEAEEQVKDKIKEYELCNYIAFFGRIEKRNEIALHYRIAELLLFPSVYDASSLVQVEAASQKTPSLFVKDSVAANMIENGFNGYTEVNDSVKFAKKIIKIFSDEILLKKVSENTYKTLYNNWGDIVKEISADYVKVIDKHK